MLLHSRLRFSWNIIVLGAFKTIKDIGQVTLAYATDYHFGDALSGILLIAPRGLELFHAVLVILVEARLE